MYERGADREVTYLDKGVILIHVGGMGYGTKCLRFTI